VAWCR